MSNTIKHKPKTSGEQNGPSPSKAKVQVEPAKSGVRSAERLGIHKGQGAAVPGSKRLF